MIASDIDVEITTRTFIDNAEKIGREILAGTYWDEQGSACNWMGRAELEEGPSTIASGALVASIYAGSAGVALFLIELFAITRDPELLRTARGAIRRSFGNAAAVARPHTSRISFWSGELGVAYAASRLEEVSGDDEFDASIERAIDGVERALSESHPLDLMGGSAGAIAPLMAIARHDRFARCRELALRCGAEILETAVWSGGLCSWDAIVASGGQMPTPPWSGLSHGASGMAVAMFDIFELTGDERYLVTARGAIAYEDTLFSPHHANWLDVRFPHAMQGGMMSGSFQTTWCHGAPGIALARLRAMAGDPAHRDHYEASGRLAVTTTIGAIELALAGPPADTSLCHGAAGLIEVLLTAAILLDDPILRRSADDYARRLIERHAPSGEWPSGITTKGATPSLMIGSSGVGYHFLRHHAPGQVPGLLLFGR